MTNVVSDLLPVCVPETKGRSLEDMDAVFHDSSAHDEAERRKKVLQTLLDARSLNLKPVDTP